MSTHCVSEGERVPQHSAWRVKVNYDGYCTHTENTSVLFLNLTRHVYGFGSGAETNIRIRLHVQYANCQYISLVPSWAGPGNKAISILSLCGPWEC